MRRFLRRWWRRLWYPRIRLPGKYPWGEPDPLPRGTVLIEADFPIVADGKGGVTVITGPRASAPRTR